MDASIIEASSSTKNRTGQRDPEMHQVKKGNQYYFGMKLHIGVDAVTGMVHSFSTRELTRRCDGGHRLLHGRESQVWGDAWVRGGAETGGEPEGSGGLAGGAEARAAAEAGTG